MRAVLPRTRLIQGFGQTETMATGSMLPDDGATLDVADPRRQSAGRAAYGIQLGIFDDSGQPVAAGAPRQILIRRPSAIPGYLNTPPESAPPRPARWCHYGRPGLSATAR